jgi:hypothetical protein
MSFNDSVAKRPGSTKVSTLLLLGSCLLGVDLIISGQSQLSVVCVSVDSVAVREQSRNSSMNPVSQRTVPTSSLSLSLTSCNNHNNSKAYRLIRYISTPTSLCYRVLLLLSGLRGAETGTDPSVSLEAKKVMNMEMITEACR